MKDHVTMKNSEGSIKSLWRINQTQMLIKVYYTIMVITAAFIRDASTAAAEELVMNSHHSSKMALNSDC